MAFSRSRSSMYTAIRQPKEINPVVDLTLILLGSSGSNKCGVAKQIQHHLKGCILPDEDDPATGSEQVPLNECQTCVGKVLGLKITTVNTPDVTDDRESNRTLRNKMRDLACGEFVVVMVTGMENEEERRIEMEHLVNFNQSVFGKNSKRYSIVVLTCTENNTELGTNSTTEDTNGIDTKKEETDHIPQMTFDINANKCDNDKQVQMLLNHAKSSVKKTREECPASSGGLSSSSSSSLPSHAVNGHGDTLTNSSTCHLSGDGDHQTSGDGNQDLNLTLDNLNEEECECLDNCCEVFDDNTIFPSPRDEQEMDVLHQQDSNPQNISFVTANPLGFGDLQC